MEMSCPSFSHLASAGISGTKKQNAHGLDDLFHPVIPQPSIRVLFAGTVPRMIDAFAIALLQDYGLLSVSGGDIQQVMALLSAL